MYTMPLIDIAIIQPPGEDSCKEPPKIRENYLYKKNSLTSCVTGPQRLINVFHPRQRDSTFAFLVDLNVNCQKKDT